MGDLGTWLHPAQGVFRAHERIRRRELADEPLFRGPYDATYDLARRLLEGDTASLRPGRATCRCCWWTRCTT